MTTGVIHTKGDPGLDGEDDGAFTKDMITESRSDWAVKIPTIVALKASMLIKRADVDPPEP